MQWQRVRGILVASTFLLGTGCQELAPVEPEAGTESDDEPNDDDGRADDGSTGETETGTDASSGGTPESVCLIGDDCGAEEYCTAGSCLPRGAEGAVCEEDWHCLRDLYCVLGSCGDPQPAGSPCEKGTDCVDICYDGTCWVECDSYQCDEPGDDCCGDGQFCWDPPREPSYMDHCRPQVGEGGACDPWNEATMCVDGLYCDGATCLPRLREGANCDYTNHWPECEEGLECDLLMFPPICVPA